MQMMMTFCRGGLSTPPGGSLILHQYDPGTQASLAEVYEIMLKIKKQLLHLRSPSWLGSERSSHPSYLNLMTPISCYFRPTENISFLN